MEEAMPLSWNIEVDWEELDAGPAEERACFAALGIYAHERWLTEGHDTLANRLRQKPFLSAYHLAEWAAWNWWRLRWESRASAGEWSQSHRIASIGSGYIWPDITIFSDGERLALVAKPTLERPETPFRYISDFAAVISAGQFEAGLDEFFYKVLNRLDSEGVGATNFEEIWKSLCEERSTPDLGRVRKLEALLGAEPDEADPGVIKQLLIDAEEFNQDAVEEIATDRDRKGNVLTVSKLKEMAERSGYEIAPKDSIRLPARSGLRHRGDVAAWRLGADAARALRDQEHLDGRTISDQQLAKRAGTAFSSLSESSRGADLSFAIDENASRGRLVLRSKWHTGRRFELARLVGDRILAPRESRLFPAMRSHTYRQKMQRAFAAEFLSPFEAVVEMLGGDYSMESQQDVAEHFDVSEMTIRTLLINHNRLGREQPDAADFEVIAA
jgi:hypothetical protein